MEAFASTHLTTLDCIQYSACRTILGALRCTPTHRLEIEANLMPLTLRQNMLLAQYGVRILTVPQQPVRDFLCQYHPPFHLLSNTYVKSVLHRLHELLTTLDLLPSIVPQVPLHLKYSISSLPVYATMHQGSKASYTATQWQQLFADLIQKSYANHNLLYCDGSMRPEGTGCGVWSADFQLIARLPPGTSIFTAELYAIYSTLTFIQTLTDPHVVFTDSLSSIHAFQNLTTNAHYLVYYIRQLLTRQPNVTIEWVPSHCGITGNERADSLATASLRLPQFTKVQPSQFEIRHKISAHYRNQWQREWLQRHPMETAFKPKLSPPQYTTLNRHIQVPLTRLRLGVSQLSHGHYFKSRPPPMCPTCNTTNTPEHHILRCPTYNPTRKEILNACKKLNKPVELITLLSPQFPTGILVKFLQESGLLEPGAL